MTTPLLPVPATSAGKLAVGGANFLLKAISPIKHMLVGFVPRRLIARVAAGQMTAREVQSCVGAFSAVSEALNADIGKRAKKLLAAKSGLTVVRQQQELEYLEKTRRYLSTVNDALTIGLKGRLDGGAIGTGVGDEWEVQPNAQTSDSWFAMFREMAERRCEPWRRQLLSRAAALELQQSNAISLKSLWNIGMLETDQFELFSLFLNSAVYVDGYPVSLVEDEALELSLDTYDGQRSVRFAYVTGTLVEHGLLSNNSVDIENVEAILVKSKSASASIVSELRGRKKPLTPVLRLQGSRCTDLGLDLARLCEARLNDVSDVNFRLLSDLFVHSKAAKFRVDA